MSAAMKNLLAAFVVLAGTFMLTAALSTPQPSAQISAGPTVFYWTVEVEPQQIDAVTSRAENLRAAVNDEFGGEFEFDMYRSHLGVEGRTRFYFFGKCRDLAHYGELRERIDSTENLRIAFDAVAFQAVSTSSFETLLLPIAAGASKKEYPYRMRRTARMTKTGDATSAARQLTDYLNAKYAERVTVSAFRHSFGDPSIIHFYMDLESYAGWQAMEESFRTDKQVQGIMQLADDAVEDERDLMLKRL